jgi:ABC-type lipoprotein export system ATPase subunit
MSIRWRMVRSLDENKNASVQTDENRPLIYCENLVKIYKTPDLEVVALQGLDLEIQAGELMAIIGNSGSGKSTLLNMLGALDRPSAGALEVNGYNLLKMTPRQIIEYKRETVGFVWQTNARNLIPYLTAVENIEIPMIIDGARGKRKRAEELLDMVGLSHRRKNKLRQLSGGEQQRVAIAIALANNPKILLADEPTGAVDTRTASKLMDLLRELNRSLGLTVIIVTHDRHLSSQVDRVVNIRDGRTSSEFIRRSYASDLKALSRDLPHQEVPEDKTHEEFVVVDRVGRMQVPREYMDAHQLKSNARLRFEYSGDRLILSPIRTEDAEKPDAAAPAESQEASGTKSEK